MTIGNRIIHQREIKGMSQTELAKKVNISKQTLYKYEKNIITNIPSDNIQKIAECLDVSPAYLMGWEDSLSNIATNLLAESLHNEEFWAYVKKLVQLNAEHKDIIFNSIDFLYNKERS